MSPEPPAAIWTQGQQSRRNAFAGPELSLLIPPGWASLTAGFVRESAALASAVTAMRGGHQQQPRGVRTQQESEDEEAPAAGQPRRTRPRAKVKPQAKQ